MTSTNKNALAHAAAFFQDDSDDEAPRQTKTQAKKAKAAVAEQAVAKPARQLTQKQVQQATNEGFDVVTNERPQTGARGGRGGRGGEGRGRGGEGRGGRGGNREDRPQTGRGRGGPRGGRGENRGRGRGAAGGERGRGGRTDAEGNPIRQRNEREGRDRHEGDEGKEHGGMDRRDGTGRGRRGAAKGGAGKFNEGARPEGQYKKRDVAGAVAEETATETREEEKVAEPEYEEVVYGVSWDDYFAENPATGAKQARAAAGVAKDVKTQANTAVKEHEQTTKLVNKTAYAIAGRGAVVADAGLTVGFAPEEAPAYVEGESRGGRGGRGRGGRGGGDRVAQQGNKRQNARHALKKTDDDFPSL